MENCHRTEHHRTDGDEKDDGDEDDDCDDDDGGNDAKVYTC